MCRVTSSDLQNKRMREGNKNKKKGEEWGEEKGAKGRPPLPLQSQVEEKRGRKFHRRQTMKEM